MRDSQKVHIKVWSNIPLMCAMWLQGENKVTNDSNSI